MSYKLGLTAKDPSIVQTNGRLTGNKLALTLVDHLEYKQEYLTADGKRKVSLASQIKVNYKGNLDLKKTDLQMDAMSSSAENITWQGSNGDVNLTLTPDNSMNLMLDGGLQTKAMQTKLIESGLLLSQQSLEISAKGFTDIGQDIVLKGTISLLSNGFTILEDDDQAPLLSLESFAIDSIDAPGGQKVTIKQAEARELEVGFAPAESEIPDSLQDYFDRLAQILQDKPEADLQLCPKSSAWEFVSESKKETLDETEMEPGDKDREKLLQAGQERALKIRDCLVQNYSIDKDRLLICVTQIETKKSAKPRVDIQM